MASTSPLVSDSSPTFLQRKMSISSRTPLRKETLHSAEAWEAKRDVIKELYMDQNKPLREVSRILEKQHMFIASPKQYKIRFKQWGYWKNLSTQHASSLLQLKKSRESQGKPSTFVRSGQKLEQLRIERTIRRSRARASAKHQESEQNTSELLLAVPSVSNSVYVPKQPLPTGIECRTPSPEPQLDQNMDITSLDSCHSLDPELCARSSSAAYDFEAAVVPHEQQDNYLDRLRTCDIAMRKLWIAHFSWGTPAPPSDQLAGLQAFRRRNTLLAVLEPAIVDKNRLCKIYLQNYAATFLECPILSLFSHQYVLPALDVDGRGGDTMALAREADGFIQTGISLLNLSAHTITLIESAATLHQSRLMEDDLLATQYEDVIDPAVLNSSLGTDVLNLSFAAVDFKVFEDRLVDSSGSSPATTTFSVSDYAMSPSTAFSGSSPATEAEGSVPEVCVYSAEPGQTSDTPEFQLSRQLDLSVWSYQSGDTAAAVTGLRRLATSEGITSPRGEVLTRMAWFCLSCIHRQEGMMEAAGNCLVKAVRGSTHFRDDRGEEWDEVSHLFCPN